MNFDELFSARLQSRVHQKVVHTHFGSLPLKLRCNQLEVLMPGTPEKQRDSGRVTWLQ
jgi:hypothetical protein